MFNEAPSFYLPAYVRTDDGPVADSCESLDDEPGAGHLRQPVVVGAVQPVVLLLACRDRERTDLVALPMQLLQSARVNVSRIENSHVTHRASWFHASCFITLYGSKLARSGLSSLMVDLIQLQGFRMK